MVSAFFKGTRTSIDVPVGKLIMMRRLAIELSVIDLASISNVPSDIIQGFEKGSVHPSPLQLAKLSDCLSIPIDWFFSNRNADAAPLQVQIALEGDLSHSNDNPI